MEVIVDSILTSIKKLLGITEEYTHFDPDLIMHINSIFFTLNQLGVGPEKPFTIRDSSATWDDFQSENIEAVRTYIGLRARLYFDPPTNSSLLNAMKEDVRELEFRLNVAVDPKEDV